ncbi:hypothetical protein ABIA03_005810 [Bradyrhizobium yuanmingense]|uniref:Uncharacterized protein n=1 Tax=Bradyrhizobium yuanmingense TaxID=108015 RepID=A0ABV4G8Q4_9BRAD|nr:hypothetical protein [Bradyrhizobium yuanmingense]
MNEAARIEKRGFARSYLQRLVAVVERAVQGAGYGLEKAAVVQCVSVAGLELQRLFEVAHGAVEIAFAFV